MGVGTVILIISENRIFILYEVLYVFNMVKYLISVFRFLESGKMQLSFEVCNYIICEKGKRDKVAVVNLCDRFYCVDCYTGFIILYMLSE